MSDAGPVVRAFRPFGRVLDFRGRSRRADFWPYILLLAVIYIIGFAILFAGGIRGGSFGSMTMMAMYIGLLSLLAFAAAVRRMHDVGWSGWWVDAYVLITLLFIVIFVYVRSRALDGNDGDLFGLLPVVLPLTLIQNGLGLLILVVCFLDGAPGPNRYGESPKSRAGRV